jgi:hypothetical protein
MDTPTPNPLPLKGGKGGRCFPTSVFPAQAGTQTFLHRPFKGFDRGNGAVVGESQGAGVSHSPLN